MAKRQLMGYRHKQLVEPVDWILRHDKRAVFHRIEGGAVAATPDGDMLLVTISHKTELADPGNDVAVLIGQVVMSRKSGVKDPLAPELWFWNDAFWVKARASDGTPYYSNDKKYLIYQVQVQRVDELMDQIRTGFDPET